MVNVNKDAIRNILSDVGISINTQECYTEEELYNFALEVCLSRGETLEDVLSGNKV